MIKELYLENWKSHEKSYIQFDKINLIIGKMGSGKTSITDAISYALFGNFSDLNSKRIKLEDIIMKKPVEKFFSKVVLKMQINGKEYEVIRTIEKGKGSYSEVKENGKIIVSGTTESNNFLKKILKIDFDTFINVVYAEQNKIDFFLNLERGERKVKFDQMMGIEKMERIRKTAVSLKNRLLDIHKEKDRLYSQLVSENLENKLREIKNQINELSEKIEKYKKEKEKIGFEVKNLEESVEKGKMIEKEINELERERIKIETNIKNLEKFLEEISKEVGNLERSVLEDEIKNLTFQINEADKKLKEFSVKINDLEKNKDLLAKNLLEINFILERRDKLIKELEEIKDVEIKSLELSNEIEKLKSLEDEKINSIKNIEIEIKKIANVLSLLEREESACPVCKSPLDKKRRLELKAEYKDLESKLSLEKEEIKKELEEIKKRLNELENIQKDISRKIIKIENIKSELEKLKSYNINDKIELENKINKIKEEISSLKNESEKINEELLKLKNQIKEKNLLIEKIERLNSYREEIIKLKETLEKVLTELESLKKVEEYVKLSENEKTLKEKKIELEKLNSEIISSQKILNILESREKEILERIKMQEKLKSEKEYLERVIKDLEILEESVKIAQAKVRSMLLDAINYYLSIYWKKLYPYRDYIDARFVASENDYVLQIKDSLGRWIELDKVASGGERTLAAICLRIAFSKVFSPILNIIIFDEPTHNLDENAIYQFAKIINENFPEIFDQVFIITHDERFKSIVNANIIKVERDKLEDKPSQIVQEI